MLVSFVGLALKTKVCFSVMSVEMCVLGRSEWKSWMDTWS